MPTPRDELANDLRASSAGTGCSDLPVSITAGPLPLSETSEWASPSLCGVLKSSGVGRLE